MPNFNIEQSNNERGIMDPFDIYKDGSDASSKNFDIQKLMTYFEVWYLFDERNADGDRTRFKIPLKYCN